MTTDFMTWFTLALNRSYVCNFNLNIQFGFIPTILLIVIKATKEMIVIIIPPRIRQLKPWQRGTDSPVAYQTNDKITGKYFRRAKHQYLFD